MRTTLDEHLNGGESSSLGAETEAIQTIHTVRAGALLGILFSIGLTVGAETAVVYAGVLGGVFLYSLLLVAFVSFSYLSRAEPVRQIYLALTLLPLLRILSLVLIIPRLQPFLQYALTGAPILITGLMLNRSIHLGVFSSRMDKTARVWQIAFGLSGVPLGIAAYMFLRTPIFFINASSSLPNVLTWISLTVFGSITEEVIFRGVLQNTLARAFGFFGVVLASLLYAGMFLGTLTFAAVIFFLALSLFFGLWVKATKSITGAIVAHSMLNLVVLVLLSVL